MSNKSTTYHTGFLKLAEWRFSVCPTCQFKNSCEGQRKNISKCIEEALEEDDPVDFLLSSTIRSMTLFDYKKTKISGEGFETVEEPRCLAAVLICSDIDEFSRCTS